MFVCGGVAVVVECILCVWMYVFLLVCVLCAFVCSAVVVCLLC